ncbi:MAG: aconitase X [Acetivibrionales bacterium]|jgi:predicted aconitase
MALKLTRYEQEMLDGKHGWPKQKGMEILFQMGQLYGATHMIPVQNVHMVNASIMLAGSAAIKLAERMVAEGARFVTRTTLNPASVDLDNWERYGFIKEDYEAQKKLTDLLARMGAIPVHCCTPYLVGQVPSFGEDICWGESSAVIYANSVLGARTNRNGGPVSLAASLTGVVPAYGYHLVENRYGTLQVNVNVPLKDIYDYGLLGFCIGELVEDGVPVFNGIEKSVTPDELKQLGSSLATSGAVALFHAVGITPEAPTLEAAFGPKKPDRVIDIGIQEMKATAEKLKQVTESDYSIVYIGCPHASLEEIAEVAELIKGKKLKRGIEFWVQTGQPIKALAERCGYVKTIEDAGAFVVCDTCPSHCFTKNLLASKKYKSMATNSPKMCHYGWNNGKIPTAVYSVSECVEIALNGKCEVERWK